MRDYDLSLYREKRKPFASNDVKNESARKTEIERQGYLSSIEKQAPKDNMQAKHKPYQCDIKLK